MDGAHCLAAPGASSWAHRAVVRTICPMYARRLASTHRPRSRRDRGEEKASGGFHQPSDARSQAEAIPAACTFGKCVGERLVRWGRICSRCRQGRGAWTHNPPKRRRGAVADDLCSAAVRGPASSSADHNRSVLPARRRQVAALPGECHGTGARWFGACRHDLGPRLAS
jgi:hypothetical protein